jgi:hypothetical protein
LKGCRLFWQQNASVMERPFLIPLSWWDEQDRRNGVV